MSWHGQACHGLFIRSFLLELSCLGAESVRGARVLAAAGVYGAATAHDSHDTDDPDDACVR